MANYGLRPTVEKATVPQLETHVLGPCPLDAGDAVTVEWLELLRPEIAFSGVDELRSRIGADVQEARAWFAQRGHSGGEP